MYEIFKIIFYKLVKEIYRNFKSICNSNMKCKKDKKFAEKVLLKFFF